MDIEKIYITLIQCLLRETKIKELCLQKAQKMIDEKEFGQEVLKIMFPKNYGKE